MRRSFLFLFLAAMLLTMGAVPVLAQEDPRPVPVIEVKTLADGKYAVSIGTDGQRAIHQDDLQVREGNIGFARGEDTPFNGWVYRMYLDQNRYFLVWCCQCRNGIPEGLEYQFYPPKDGKGGGILRIKEFKGRKQIGLDSVYDEKGRLRNLTAYADGKQNGLSKNFHENGKIYSEHTYKDGEYDGLFRCWDTSGQLQLEQTYSSGKGNGPYKKWYDNGKLKESGEYVLVEKDGNRRSEKQGLWKEFREEDGSLCIERDYDKGTRLREAFFNNVGGKSREIHWTPERAHLTVHFKEKNGFPTQLWMQNTDTKKHGTQVTWYFEEEQISVIENYVNDQRHGPFEYFDFKGKLTRRGYNRNNVETDTPVERPIVPEFEEILQKYMAMGVPKGANWPKPNVKVESQATVEAPATAASALVPPPPLGLSTDSTSMAIPASNSLSVASILDAVVSTVVNSTETSPASTSASAVLTAPAEPTPYTVPTSPTTALSSEPFLATASVSDPVVQTAPTSPVASVAVSAPVAPVVAVSPDTASPAVAKVTCPSCGKEVAPGTFCLECGSSLAQEKKCIKCQRTLPVKARFCNDCGAAQTAPVAVAEPAPVEPPAAPDDPPVAVADAPKPVSVNPVEKLLGQMRASNKAERYDDVIKKATELLRLEPGHIEGLYLRGCAWQQKGQYDEARVDLRKVVEKKPDHALAYFQLGLTYRAEKNLEKAVSCFEKTAKLAPKHERSRFFLFDCLSDLGRFEESLRYIQDAERLNPGDSNNTYNVGFNLIKLKRFREALDKLLTIEKKADRMPAIHKCMAVSYAGLGNAEKALQHCKAFLKRHPDDEWASEFVKEQSQASAAPAVSPVKADLNAYVNNPTVKEVDARMQEMFKEMQTMSNKSNAQVRTFLEGILPFLAQAKKAMGAIRPATASIRQIHELYLQSISDIAEGARLLSRAIRDDSKKMLDAGTAALKRGTDKRQNMLQMISEVAGK